MAGRRGSIDLVAETRSCSLCDTDDLSSGSLYDDCCLGHESVRHDVPSGPRTADILNVTTSYPNPRSHHHHHLFVDCSPGRASGGLPTGQHSSVDPENGNPPFHAHGQPNDSGKFSTVDRQTLSLSNPADPLHSPSHPPTSPPGPSDSSRLDKFYTPPASHNHPVTYSRRASTLPSAKTLRSRPERSDNLLPRSGHHDSVEEVELEVEAEGEAEDELVVDGFIRRSDSQPHPGRTASSVTSGGASAGLDRLLHRFVYATTVGRRHARYNTMTATSSGSSSVCPSPVVVGGIGSGFLNANRKLSSQSDAGMTNHFVEDGAMEKFTSADRLANSNEAVGSVRISFSFCPFSPKWIFAW